MRSLPILLLSLFAACASTPTLPEGVPAPDENQRERDLQKAEQRRRDFSAVLVRLGQAMDSYVIALNRKGDPHADESASQLEKLIRETVLDLGPQVKTGNTTTVTPMGDNFLRLKAQATDGTVPEHQAIALAALGFCQKPEVMPLILQGAQLSDPVLVDNAVLGLAILHAPATPPGVLAAIVEDQKHPEEGRTQAAWALYRIQEACQDPAPFVAIWKRCLANRDVMPIGVLVQSIRGLGLTRDATHADDVVPFLQHPTPFVRMAAALALGRMNAQSKWRDLLALLEPSETVQNVRLTARKALVALAGGVDYSYDISAWRKTFERAKH